VSKAGNAASSSGTPPVRTPADLAGWDAAADLGFPGEFPFTRGIQPTMYRGRLWTMRQYAGFATAGESNARYRYLLAQGVSGLSVASTCRHRWATTRTMRWPLGEVGRVGVAIDSIEDMGISSTASRSIACPRR
jgi:methylmalonyl-CoA mutase N-terminal domain/subunit